MEKSFTFIYYSYFFISIIKKLQMIIKINQLFLPKSFVDNILYDKTSTFFKSNSIKIHSKICLFPSQVWLRMPRPPPAEMPESMRKRLEAEEVKSKWKLSIR